MRHHESAAARNPAGRRIHGNHRGEHGRDPRIAQSLRDSRLFRSLCTYLTRSIATIVRIYVMYRPMRVFFTLGGTLFVIGFLIGCRFLYYYLTGAGAGRVQSLLLAVLLMVVGFQTGLTGLLADLIGNNRRLVEETLWRVRRLELQTPESAASGVDEQSARE